jgi:transposase
MRRFVEQADRGQWTLLPECLDDFIDESNPVRVIDVFVDALDLAEMSFEGVEPAATGRPSYHPSVLLKLYIYGYLNRVQSSRRLEREAGRNVEVMWLLGRLAPDHKTIADFRKDNGLALRKVCARFVELCREMGPHQNAPKSSRRDGSLGPGLQSHTGDQHRREQATDGCARGLRPSRSWLLTDFPKTVFLHGQDPRRTSGAPWWREIAARLPISICWSSRHSGRG